MERGQVRGCGPSLEGAANLVAIAEAGDSVLAPSVGLGTGQLVGQVRPGVPVRAVVLAHGPPGPLRQIRTPLVPAGAMMRVAAQTQLLGIHRSSTGMLNVKC